MNRLARYAGAAQKLVADNSPTILTVAAVTGVIATTYLVAKAAPKAHIDILNEQSERVDELDLADKVLLTYKHYIPAVVTGTLTVSCIIMANSINMKRTSALAGAVGLSELAFKNYRDKVVEHIGGKKEERVHDEVMQDFVEANPAGSQFIVSDSGKQLFCDRYSERYFESDMESVKRAVNDTNFQILEDDYASLNDLYRRLEIKPSSVGEELGWTTEKRLEARYSAQIITDENGRTRACIVIEYAKNPIRNFDRFG